MIAQNDSSELFEIPQNKWKSCVLYTHMSTVKVRGAVSTGATGAMAPVNLRRCLLAPLDLMKNG